MSDIEEGTRVVAPNPLKNEQVEAGTIVDVLSVMYFIKFDTGDESFVYKARRVKELV